MDATYNFSLGFAQGAALKTVTPERLLKLQALQKISTGMSLVSLSLGFSIVGMLIIANRHQADLSGLTGGNSIAMVGGISAMLVGAAFVVAACLHWRSLLFQHREREPSIVDAELAALEKKALGGAAPGSQSPVGRPVEILTVCIADGSS